MKTKLNVPATTDQNTIRNIASELLRARPDYSERRIEARRFKWKLSGIKEINRVYNLFCTKIVALADIGDIHISKYEGHPHNRGMGGVSITVKDNCKLKESHILNSARSIIPICSNMPYKDVKLPKPKHTKTIETERTTIRHTDGVSESFYKFARRSKFPNIATMNLNDETVMEVHEFPVSVDGEALNMDEVAELEEVNHDEVLIRVWGFKIRLTRV